MAVEDDIIRKNPFKFKLSDVVPKDAYVRNALTREQQEKYLQFVQDYGGNYYDDIVILMGTGLRVSELYGLTRSDIDFERHCIHVLRHTFCTNVQQAGLDVKSLQYLMGHSNASVTLDVYTHSSFESVERAFEQIAGNL